MKKITLWVLVFLYSAFATAHPEEMILAGGALKICTSMSKKDCNNSEKEFFHARKASRYQIKQSDIATILNPVFWSMRIGAPARSDLQAMLTVAKQKSRGDIYSAAKLEDILSAICIKNAKVINCTGKDAKNAWHNLLDEERSFILSAFEVPEFSNGQRLREIANINDSKNPHGANILKTFVKVAALRSPGKRPRILFVTASSADPYDAVDFYFSALKQAGADPIWWPIDQAMSAAIYNGRGCNALPQLRIEKLALADREQIFSDLSSMQKTACENPEALAALPSQAQGIFFSGGDQWRLRKALFDGNDQPNAWLTNLKTAFARGDLVVAGTSAGTAVQSGLAMLSNGTSKNAIHRGSKIGTPVSTGCERAKRCLPDLEEDDLSYWPNGGLNLLGGWVMDTHFSERARELRLLQLLHDAHAKTGFGIDETSALHLIRTPPNLQIEALGASGAWLFDFKDSTHNTAKINAQVHYLAPGRIFQWTQKGLMMTTAATKPVVVNALRNPLTSDALQEEVMRNTVQQMAVNGTLKHILTADMASVSLSLSPETETWTGPQGQVGVTHVMLELSR